METIKQAHDGNNLNKLKTIGLKLRESAQLLFRYLVAVPARQCLVLGKAVCTKMLVPGAVSGARLVKKELVNIHSSQNWIKRCSMTFSGNAVGMIMAMSSTKIVEHFVETREMGNLWGLLATRPVVSDATYEMLAFAEFLV